jgi:hypothetical protein
MMVVVVSIWWTNTKLLCSFCSSQHQATVQHHLLRSGSIRIRNISEVGKVHLFHGVYSLLEAQ